MEAGELITVELLPHRSLARLLAGVRALLKGEGRILYQPGVRTSPAHLTVYTGHFPSIALPKVVRSIKGIAERVEPLRVQVNGIGVFADGTVHLTCAKGSSLLSLRRSLIASLRKWRGLVALPDRMARQFTSSERRRLERIGDPFGMTFFKPHISVAQIAAPASRLKNAIKPARDLRLLLTMDRLRVKAWRDVNAPPRILVQIPLRRNKPL